ncbi:MAG: class I SAM-dependent methyltransferase [Dehalococcoidia bacterium]
MAHDIFAGTADYYARYRVDYPQGLYDVARRAFALEGEPRGTLLDLGTGTGFLALELAPHFARVVGVDVEPAMLRHAAIAADARGVTNAAWRVAPAEELAALDGTIDGPPYRLVTAGSAFHWMDQVRILELLRSRLEPGGGVFLAGLPGFISIDDTRQTDPLAAVILPVVQRYLGAERRAGNGSYRPPGKRWEVFLAEAGYEGIEVGYVPFTVEFDLDGIVGLLYSTSFANRRLLGDQVEAFEKDLREAVLAFEPSGRYQRSYEAEWVLASWGGAT